MSGNGGEAAKLRTDRRVLRTRDTLGDALVELLQEKTFDEITVQEVLDRAGVGRSTFYAHYKDKEDLFISDVEEFFVMLGTLLKRRGERAERVAPVAEIFTHVGSARGIYGAMVASGKLQDVFELGQGVMARSIEERLRAAGVEMEGPMLAAYATALAGSLFALLQWWIDKGMKESAEEMDGVFHRMVWKGLGGVRKASEMRSEDRLGVERISR